VIVSFDQALGIAGAIASLAGTAWAILHYVMGRLDAMREQMSKAMAEVHARVDGFHADYVRRDDYHRDMESLRGDVAGIRDDVKQMGGGINSRLDQLFLARALGTVGAGAGE